MQKDAAAPGAAETLPTCKRSGCVLPVEDRGFCQLHLQERKDDDARRARKSKANLKSDAVFKGGPAVSLLTGCFSEANWQKEYGKEVDASYDEAVDFLVNFIEHADCDLPKKNNMSGDDVPWGLDQISGKPKMRELRTHFRMGPNMELLERPVQMGRIEPITIRCQLSSC